MDWSQIKIIELAGVLAGPASGSFFAELGAEVIKIENPATGGDLTRRWKSPAEDTGAAISAYYASVNRKKTVVWKNLKKEKDREDVHEMIATADVVIANFKPDSAASVGMDYQRLSKDNPRLIYANLSGFGKSDNRPAFDVVLQAESGFISMCGTDDGPPVKMPVALIDVLAAHQLNEAILLALLERENSGKGAEISCDLYSTALVSLINQSSNWLMAGHLPRPMGTLHPNIAPYGETFSCSDGKKLILAVGTDVHFKKLCAIAGKVEIAEDKRFATNENRVRYRKELNAILSEVFAGDTREVFLKQLAQAGVPAGALYAVDEALGQEKAQKLIHTETIEGVEAKSMKSIAFEMTSH